MSAHSFTLRNIPVLTTGAKRARPRCGIVWIVCGKRMYNPWHNVRIAQGIALGINVISAIPVLIPSFSHPFPHLGDPRKSPRRAIDSGYAHYPHP